MIQSCRSNSGFISKESSITLSINTNWDLSLLDIWSAIFQLIVFDQCSLSKCCILSVLSDVTPSAVHVGNIVQGARMAQAQGRELASSEDESDRKVGPQVRPPLFLLSMHHSHFPSILLVFCPLQYTVSVPLFSIF